MSAAVAEQLRFPIEPPMVPLTDAEWERVLGGQPFRVLVRTEQIDWAGARAVRCPGCSHAGDSGHGEPWRAWCLAHRCVVSNTFAKLCWEYVRR